ncbi:hypothetical protein GCM10010172_58120 [Paractinoplanes ferrugineus]|uniref:Uncharacterized protein n=1 Tax=Paractinoplanes ferrugineus TaxID=113564 RepID=A0A919J980_9ACTN|nr:hypothetical protein [Actinoplanes ferrugineus]GIE15884.1 hypothetical protein Afe05nite_77240 [Actinoplanes ferrugineus]
MTAETKTIRESAPDRVLGLMIDALNSSREAVDTGIWVALTVRGTMITGEMIPHWQWFDEQTTLFGEGSHVAYFASVMKESRDEHVALMGKDDADLTPEERWELNQPPAFVHLRKAKTYLPDPVSEAGHYWRGRLEDVSGWSFGQLSQVTPGPAEPAQP